KPVSPRSKHLEPDPELDVLFSTPSDQFVAVRNELAAKAQAAGRHDLAIRLKSVKRPSMVVWLANAVAREAPQAIRSLLDAGAKLRNAYSSNDRQGIRDATEERHQALREALRHGKQILAKAGHSRGTERRLTEILMAAAMDTAQARLLLEGRLAQEIEPPRL